MSCMNCTRWKKLPLMVTLLTTSQKVRISEFVTRTGFDEDSQLLTHSTLSPT